MTMGSSRWREGEIRSVTVANVPRGHSSDTMLNVTLVLLNLKLTCSVNCFYYFRDLQPSNSREPPTAVLNETKVTTNSSGICSCCCWTTDIYHVCTHTLESPRCKYHCCSCSCWRWLLLRYACSKISPKLLNFMLHQATVV